MNLRRIHNYQIINYLNFWNDDCSFELDKRILRYSFVSPSFKHMEHVHVIRMLYVNALDVVLL
jgi:hypothetical protein